MNQPEVGQVWEEVAKPSHRVTIHEIQPAIPTTDQYPGLSACARVGATTFVRLHKFNGKMGGYRRVGEKL